MPSCTLAPVFQLESFKVVRLTCANTRYIINLYWTFSGSERYRVLYLVYIMGDKYYSKLHTDFAPLLLLYWLPVDMFWMWTHATKTPYWGCVLISKYYQNMTVDEYSQITLSYCHCCKSFFFGRYPYKFMNIVHNISFIIHSQINSIYKNKIQWVMTMAILLKNLLNFQKLLFPKRFFPMPSPI